MSISSKLAQYGDHTENISMKFNISAIIIKHEKIILYSNKRYNNLETSVGMIWEGFPNSSVGKESACNAGDPSSIPGSVRSAEEWKGYPLQYSWASLVTQLVKRLPAMWETWVRSLGWGDPLEKGKATHSSVLAWRIPWTV